MNDEKTEKPWYKTWWGVLVVIAFFYLIVPYLVWTKTNWNKWFKVGVTGACIMFFTAIISNANPPAESPKNTEQSTVVFDLEQVYGKNVDEIIAMWGEPVENTEPEDLQTRITSKDQLAKTWDKSFKKDGFELLVTYDVASRKVIDFFVSTDDKSGKTKNIDRLKDIINVKDSSHYSLKPVKSLIDTASFTGIIATPK